MINFIISIIEIMLWNWIQKVLREIGKLIKEQVFWLLQFILKIQKYKKMMKKRQDKYY